VIVPAYNAAATLGEQLDALRCQTFAGDWEIIVVDNRSTDGTAALVDAYRQTMPNLRLVPAPTKQGRSYACNVGADAAHGAILVFCDADDVAAPTWLESLIQAIGGHDFAGGLVETHQLNPDAPWRPNPVRDSTRPALGFLPQAPGTNMAVTRRAFEAVGGFTEDIPPCEDIDISWRLQLCGYRLGHAPDAVMHIRYRPTMRSLWQQVTSYAECHVFLYTRFKAYGMPPSSLQTVLQRYGWLIQQLPHLLNSDRQGRAHWVYRAASRWGRLRGSLRYRTLYL
jgi:GT2 family glycosyltransferase